MKVISSIAEIALAKDSIQAFWTFDFVLADTTEYHWSMVAFDGLPVTEFGTPYVTGFGLDGTVDVTEFGGRTGYEFNVLPDSFSARFKRNSSEFSLQSNNRVTFSVSNPSNTLTHGDFDNAEVTIRCFIGDGFTEFEAGIWKMVVPTGGAAPGLQKINFTCYDLLYPYLDNLYPNNVLISSLSPTGAVESDSVCVPEILGTGYMPLRPIYIDGDGVYYILGPSGPTYTVSEVRTPKQWQNDKIYNTSHYTFTQATKTIDGVSYRVLSPTLTGASGYEDVVMLFTSGDNYMDLPVKLTKSTTTTKNNHPDAIQDVLETLGVATADIDVSGTFSDSKTAMATLGIDFNHSFTENMVGRKLLAQLLLDCNSFLRFTDKVELHQRSKAYVATLDKSMAILKGGKDQFKETPLTPSPEDGCYVSWPDSGGAQDRLADVQVSPEGSPSNVSKTYLTIPWADDSQVVQRIGELYCIYKFYRESIVSFYAKPDLVLVQPDDVLRISHADYGGTYDVLVDEITMDAYLGLKFSCVKYAVALEDFSDSTPGAVTWLDDDTAVFWVGLSTIYVGQGPECQFSDIESAFNAYNGGRFFLKNGEYDLKSSGQPFPTNDFMLVAESLGGVVLKNTAGYRGFITGSPSANMTAILRNLVLESQNTSSFTDFIYLMDSARILLDIADCNFTLQDDGIDDNPSGDRGLYLYDVRGLIAGNLNFEDGNGAIYYNVQTSGRTEGATLTKLFCRGQKDRGLEMLVLPKYNDHLTKIDDFRVIEFSGDRGVAVTNTASYNYNAKTLISSGLISTVGITYPNNVAFNGMYCVSADDAYFGLKNISVIAEKTYSTGAITGIYAGFAGEYSQVADCNVNLKSTSVICVGIKDGLTTANKTKFKDNTVLIDSASNVAHRGFLISGSGARINNNDVDLVNSQANAIGFELDSNSDNCIGTGNVSDNAGSDLLDSGSGNSVSVA